MNLKPLYDHVVLKPIEAEAKSNGGIVLTGNASLPKTRAEVVAVGPGRLLEDGSIKELAVTVGDTVVLGNSAATQSETIEGQEYLIAREGSLLAVVND